MRKGASGIKGREGGRERRYGRGQTGKCEGIGNSRCGWRQVSNQEQLLINNSASLSPQRHLRWMWRRRTMLEEEMEKEMKENYKDDEDEDAARREEKLKEEKKNKYRKRKRM